MSGPPVTTKERKRMRAVYARTQNIHVVAEILKRSPDTVRRHVITRSKSEALRERHGYTERDRRRVRALYRSGLSTREVSRETGVPYPTVSAWCEDIMRSRSEAMKLYHWERRWKQAQQVARLCFDEDMTQKEAADRMGCSQSTVSRLLDVYRHPDKYRPSLTPTP